MVAAYLGRAAIGTATGAVRTSLKLRSQFTLPIAKERQTFQGSCERNIFKADTLIESGPNQGVECTIQV